MRRLVRTALAFTGSKAIDACRYAGGLALLFASACWWTFVGPLKGRGKIRYEETMSHLERVAVRSLGIVSLVLFFVGVILALQMAYVLRIFGIVEYVADVTGIAMAREMAPLLVAVVMTGFLGAAITAEIGAMVVSEEVLALESMALDPVRFLIVPRVLAAMVAMPFVSLVATYVGVLGGLAVGSCVLGLDPHKYIRRTVESLLWKDVLTGLVKAEAFGALVALIACREGLGVSGGAEGVGRATTNAVVRSIIAIIACDLVFTLFFYFLL
ncbi:MAG: MlaE family ABC transporter permease [Planctomycetota bacterium]